MTVRADWGVVWKLLPDKTIQPIRIRQGVTDLTFTAMEEGDLKVGDPLVIGEVSSNPTANTAAAGRGGLGPAAPGGGRGLGGPGR